MNKPLRKLLGVMGIGLSWGAVWGALLATLSLITGIVDPDSIDPGEGPLAVSGIGWLFGFISGVGFGVTLSIAENRKAVLDLSLSRVAIWGMLGSAAFPLLTTMNNSLMFVACPLGAVCASASVAIARRPELHDPERSRLLGLIGRVLTKPLQAACASNGRLRGTFALAANLG